MRKTLYAPIALGGLVVVLLTGCGGSSRSLSTSSPSTAVSATSSAATTSTAQAPTSSATSRATASATTGSSASAGLAAIVVRATDMPAGWKGTAYHADPSDKAASAALLKCVGARDTTADKIGEVHSLDFADGDATVSSDVERYRSQSDVTSDATVLRNPRTAPCYRTLASDPKSLGLPAGSTVLASVFGLTRRTATEPANVAGNLVAHIVVSVKGQRATLYLDSVFIQGPRIEAEIDLSNVGTRVPAAFRAALVAKVAARAAHA